MTTDTATDGMDGLTAEEREALAFDDGDPNATQGELEDQAAATNEETTNADDTSKNKGGDDTGAAAPAGDAGAAAGKADGDQPAAAAKDEPGQPSSTQAHAPILVAEAPADAEAKLKEIADQKAGLRKQYDDGDLTFEEYEAKKDELDEQKLAIKLQVETANTAVKMEAQRRQNEWAQQCDTFLAAHPEYEGGKGERFEHLNGLLKAIAVIPSNAHLTGPQLLEKAHRLALADRGEAPPPPAAKGDGKAKQDIPKPKLPPDLGGMPAAASNDPGEGKWASLDRLRDAGNGVAYEAALSKLSQADRDAYLAA